MYKMEYRPRVLLTDPVQTCAFLVVKQKLLFVKILVFLTLVAGGGAKTSVSHGRPENPKNQNLHHR